jgi:hypothetical protein
MQKKIPYECKSFCIDCEKNGSIPSGSKIETISHAADSDDYYRLFKHEYKNNMKVMIVFENPGGNINYDMGEYCHFESIRKYIPIYSYYWIDKRIKVPPKNIDELLKWNNLYGAYIAYLINRYELNNIYVTNLTKCKLNLKIDYSTIRVNCIKKYFVRELELVQPDIVLFMGQAAKKYFQWDYLKKYHFIKNVVLIHPAARMAKKDIVEANNEILDNILGSYLLAARKYV